MLSIQGTKRALQGPHGTLDILEEDEITLKLAMLIEGECEGVGPSEAARKFGYSKQRYFQLLHTFREQGAHGTYPLGSLRSSMGRTGNG